MKLNYTLNRFSIKAERIQQNYKMITKATFDHHFIDVKMTKCECYKKQVAAAFFVKNRFAEFFLEKS
ncbi:hypothetical protein CG015_18770 [Vibrio anguillarum]|nr:hypothetical protein CG015_18770 [Vibrio anguillarum]